MNKRPEARASGQARINFHKIDDSILGNLYDSSKTMSDEVKSLEALEEEASGLESTIKKILQFPDEITRPCKIPLSGVASISAKIVHTNEFLVSKDSPSSLRLIAGASWEDSIMNNPKETKKSHKGAAEDLRARLNDVKTQIRSMRVPEKAEAYKEGAANVLEIREFVDEDGKEVRSEVVNMRKEMADIDNVFEEMKKKQHQDHPRPQAAEETGQSDPFSILKSKLGALDVAARANENRRKGSDDPETAFAYEMHAAINNVSSNNLEKEADLSFLDDLEHQEQENVQREIQEGKKKQSKKQSSYGSGFKAGFLASPKKEREKEKKEARPASALQDSVIERM